MKELADLLLETVQKDPATALLVTAGAFLALLVLVIGLGIALILIARRQRHLLRGTNGQSLEAALQAQMDSSQETEQRLEHALRLGESNLESIRHCLQKVGMVRYDAFTDIGGEQSFSIALLDSGGNGLVLTGIHSRHDFRVYAKPVIASDSPVQLTVEERKAIGSAATAAVGGQGTPVSGGRAGKARV